MRYLLVTLILLSQLAKAEVREAQTMANAIEGAEAGTLVIFDLDNTVLMPPQSLGGEEWFDYFVEKRMEQGLTKEKAVDQGIEEWKAFHQNGIVIPVEAETPQLIADLQKQGAYTMALTARPIELAQSTTAQLKSIGIELNKNTVHSKNFNVPGKHKSFFYQGALLVGPKNNKGEVLAKFLKSIPFKTKKIIFIDNKQHHVVNVEKALAGTGITYFGRRHSAADAKIAALDKPALEIQHKYFFGEVLSNENAKKLVQ